MKYLIVLLLAIAVLDAFGQKKQKDTVPNGWIRLAEASIHDLPNQYPESWDTRWDVTPANLKKLSNLGRNKATPIASLSAYSNLLRDTAYPVHHTVDTFYNIRWYNELKIYRDSIDWYMPTSTGAGRSDITLLHIYDVTNLNDDKWYTYYKERDSEGVYMYEITDLVCFGNKANIWHVFKKQLVIQQAR